MLRILAAIGLGLLASSPRAAVLPETPQFRIYDIADGLPSSRISAMAQDREGYLWLATEDGLARFDGSDFRVWQHERNNPRSAPDNVLSAVCVDSKNRVWVGTSGAGLYVLEQDRTQFRQYNHRTRTEIAEGAVFTVACGPDGAIWFGVMAGGGLHRLDQDGSVTRFKPGEQGLPGREIWELTIDARGSLWVGTDRGAAFWNGQAFEALATDGIAEEVIFGISPEPDGSLWISTQAKLFHRGPNGATNVASGQWDGDRHQVVYKMIRDSGDYWLATRDGIWRGSNGQVSPVLDVPWVHSRGLVLDGLKDHEGGVWLGIYGVGLAYLPPSWRQFAFLRHRDEVPSSPSSARMQAFANSTDGKVWMVGKSNLLDKLDLASGRVQHFVVPISDKQELFGVLEAGDGSVWLGGQEGSDLLWMASDFSSFHKWTEDSTRDPVPEGYGLDRLAETADGTLWLARQEGGMQARDRAGQVLHTIRAGDGHGLNNDGVGRLAAGPEGGLWVAGAQGLLRWNEVSKRFDAVPGAPAELISSFCFVGDDLLWLSRPGVLEAYHWNGSRLDLYERVESADGLPAALASGVLATHTGVWLTTPRGLVRWDVKGRKLRVYGTNDGLPSQEFGPYPPLLTSQGIAVAAIADGVVLFDAAQEIPRAPQPRLVVQTLSLRRGQDEISLDPTRTIELGPSDRDLRVIARLLSFVDAQAHRYRFRLHGYDPDWVIQRANGERVFSRLEPGQYRLEVQAANADGVWSESRGFDLTVHPPWWRSGAAFVAYFLFGIFALWAAGGLYRVRLTRRHAVRLAIETSEAKSRFLATLGHEIRTPLTGVLGMSELMLADPLPPPQRERAVAVRGAGEHLLRLVNDTLDLARIEAGKLELDDAPFDLRKLIEETRALLAPGAERKALDFHCEIDPEAPHVLRGDVHRLRQILLNLGSNAIKFTEQGSVVLRATPLAPQGVSLEVRDSGPGLSAEQRARLFQRFSQAEGARTAARYGGSGLGLAISQELAAAMGGRIEVDSTPGVGTAFRVLLPLSSASLEAIAPGPMPPPTVASRRILLVEDDATVAAVIQGLLKAQGHDVMLAPHALAALSLLKEADFDLALLDLDLPGLDGMELARVIRSSKDAPPLVALTARADADAEPEARAAGMTGFLRKPVTGEMLAAAVEGFALLR